MEPNGRHNAFKKLVALAEAQGYLTFGDIEDFAGDLSIQDFAWLADAIERRGILTYSDNPESRNAEGTDYIDFAQNDYEEDYQKIIEMAPTLRTLVARVRNIVPPQRREINKLKDPVVDGNSYARKRMIQMHLRFALRIALAYVKMYGTDIEDTIGDAFIGLIKAVDKYNPGTSGPFSPYASLRIHRTISIFQGTQRPLMSFPNHQKERYLKIYPLAQKRGCTWCDKMPSCAKLRHFIVKKLKCGYSGAEQVVCQMVPFLSLDELIENYESHEEELFTSNSSDIMPPDLISESDDALVESDDLRISAIIEKALTSLKSKEEGVIRSRFGFNGPEATLEEIGKSYNLTRERIRQIETAAIKKLRRGVLSVSKLNKTEFREVFGL